MSPKLANGSDHAGIVQLAGAAFALEEVVPPLEPVALLVELAVPLEDDVLTLRVEIAVAASAGIAGRELSHPL